MLCDSMLCDLPLDAFVTRCFCDSMVCDSAFEGSSVRAYGDNCQAYGGGMNSNIDGFELRRCRFSGGHVSWGCGVNVGVVCAC